MKRQRGPNVNNGVSPMNNPPPKVEDMAAAAAAAVGAMGKKRSKKEGEQKVGKSVVVVEDIERKEPKEVVIGGGLQLQGGAGDHGHHHQSVMGLMSWEEYMPWLGDVADEQMSWGSTWFPGWDMDFMGEAFSALYSDVVWDDDNDIWNFRKEIPIPVDTKRTDWG